MVSPVTASVSSSQTQPVTKALSPEEAFKQLDTGNKGYLTVSDLESAVVKISDKGANLSKADAAAAAKADFAKMDTNGDGKVSATEFKAATANAPPAGGAPAGAKPPGGAGGHGGPKGGGVGSSTSSTTYAAADTNQDGVVTSLEQQAYDAKHLSAKLNTATSNSASVSAVKTYESVSTVV